MTAKSRDTSTKLFDWEHRVGRAAQWSEREKTPTTESWKRWPSSFFDLPTALTDWARLAQDRAGWHRSLTTPPFAIEKPFVRQPRGDARVTPEDRRRAVVQGAAEIAERRAVFDANNSNYGGKVAHWHPCTRRPELDIEAPGRAWGQNEMPPQTKYPPNAS